MPTGGRREWTRVFPALALLFAVAPFLVFRGRVIDEEAVGFLRKYWDADRGALVKIFDVRGWDFYQGRELSYAIDYLDAQWVGLVLRTGTLFFGAPSALLASLALVLVVARLGPRALPRLGAPARWLCLLLLLSNFVFLMTMGTLYRATKPLVAPLVLGLFLLALAEHRAPRLSARCRRARRVRDGARHERPRPAGALLRARDHGRAVVHVAARAPRACRSSPAWRRRWRPGTPTSASSAPGSSRGSRATGPPTASSGCGPSGSPTSSRGARPSASSRTGRRSSSAACRPRRSSWPRPPAPCGGRGCSAARRGGSPRPCAVAAVAIVLQLTMVAIMVEHHPPIAWVSHRLWYYPLPYQAVLVFGLMWGLDGAAARRAKGALPFIVPVALAGLVVLNVARWPEKRAEIGTDAPFADQLRRSALLVRSLQTGPRRAAPRRRPPAALLRDPGRLSPSRRGRTLAGRRGRGRPRPGDPRRPGGRVGGARGADRRAHDRARTLPARRARAPAQRRRAEDPRRAAAAAARRGGPARSRRGRRGVPRRPRPGAGRERHSRPARACPTCACPASPRRTFAGYQLLLPVALWRDERALVVDSAAPGR